MEGSRVAKGKESLLIPIEAQVRIALFIMNISAFHHCLLIQFYFICVCFYLYLNSPCKVRDASILDRCPHRSEICSVVLAESKGMLLKFNLLDIF